MKRLMDESDGSAVEGLVVDDGGGSSPPSTGFPIVGVGASAGGLEAFTQLLKHLPADSGMAFVLIQHLDPTHASFLRDALAKATPMTVSQAEDGTRVEPNHVYVIPPDADISIHDGRLTLAPRRARRSTVAPARRSSSFARSPRTAAATRSASCFRGTLRTARRACGPSRRRTASRSRRIPDSAKFGEMPRNAVNAGVVDCRAGDPRARARAVRLSRHPYVAAARRAARRPAAPTLAQSDPRWSCATRSASTSASTSSSTVERRLARRMALRRVGGCASLPGAPQGDPEEARALYEDILIHVTSFFRDPEVFEALKSQILPAILKDKPDGAPDSRLGGRLLHRRRGLLDRDRAARVPGRVSTRIPSRSSARISASRPSPRRAPGSTATARCATSATSGAGATSSRPTAATASTRRCAICACSSSTTSPATRRSRSWIW